MCFEFLINQMSHVFQINASGGGVPKSPLRSAVIDESGITVDDQADKKHHGGPLQHLCLFRVESILALQEEGHPIFPGSTGENITTAGLSNDQMQPGQQLQLGASVVIELTKSAPPCTTIADSFVGRNSNRISEKKHPGWSRMYAKVLHGGTVTVGDQITVL